MYVHISAGTHSCTSQLAPEAHLTPSTCPGSSSPNSDSDAKVLPLWQRSWCRWGSGQLRRPRRQWVRPDLDSPGPRCVNFVHPKYLQNEVLWFPKQFYLRSFDREGLVCEIFGQVHVEGIGKTTSGLVDGITTDVHVCIYVICRNPQPLP